MRLPIQWRITALAVGASATGLAAYGAYEAQLKMDQSGYLIVAAPFVAASAALIPVLVELTWRIAQPIKAICWGLLLIPAATLVFLSVAERVHYGKQAQLSKVTATQSTVKLLEAEYDRATANYNSVVAQANKATGLRKCKQQCQSKYVALVAQAEGKVETRRVALIRAKRAQVEQSAMSPPTWLLPITLDLLAFLAIWTGLAPAPEAPKQIRKAPAKRKPRKKPQPKLFSVISNDNIGEKFNY